MRFRGETFDENPILIPFKKYSPTNFDRKFSVRQLFRVYSTVHLPAVSLIPEFPVAASATCINRREDGIFCLALFCSVLWMRLEAGTV